MLAVIGVGPVVREFPRDRGVGGAKFAGEGERVGLERL
jgi:hypothetical protein